MTDRAYVQGVRMPMLTRSGAASSFRFVLGSIGNLWRVRPSHRVPSIVHAYDANQHDEGLHQVLASSFEMHSLIAG